MVLENIYGEMVHHMKVNGKTMKLLAVVTINGPTAGGILGIGEVM